MWDIILETSSEIAKIILMVIVLMTVIDFLELRYRDKIKQTITKKPLNQYLIASPLGAIPGCIDAFLIDSLYMYGLVSFGAVVAVMLSTAGDEAFIMLAMAPKTALLIFAISVIVGVIGGFLSDEVAKKIKLKRYGQPLHEVEFFKGTSSFKQFFKEHVLGHILKKHISKLFLWLFFTTLGINFLMKNFDLAMILQPILQNKFLLLIIAALIATIPESGPHLIFLVLYTKGLIPFSVLLVNSIGQDGHGLLPLLSYSVRDTVNVQIATTIVSLAIAVILFLIGIDFWFPQLD